VKTLPKARVSSAGGCFGLVVRVMAIWVKAISWTLGDDARRSYAAIVRMSRSMTQLRSG
jgi:hypothetical protein